jgi:hypothetical protein
VRHTGPLADAKFARREQLKDQLWHEGYVAQHESFVTSFSNVSAASFSPSTIVK